MRIECFVQDRDQVIGHVRLEQRRLRRDEYIRFDI